MRLIAAILPPGSVPTDIAVISLAVVLGLGLGAIRIRGIALGVSAVLFSGLLFGAIGFSVADDVLVFLRDFSLIIFVYAVGLQLGPGFFAAFRAEGLKLNALSAIVVIGGALITAAVIVGAKLPRTVAPGLYTGAFSSTPAFAAGQEALLDRLHKQPYEAGSRSAVEAVTRMSVVFSMTYPFGMLGPIVLIIALRRVFRADVEKERVELDESRAGDLPKLESREVEITRQEVASARLHDLPAIREQRVLVTRLIRSGHASVPTNETSLQVSDILRITGSKEALEEFVTLAGHETRVHRGHIHGELRRARLLVTRPSVLGKLLRELDLPDRFHVAAERLHRAGVELQPREELALQFADHLHVVGPAHGIAATEQVIGNSMSALQRPQLVPMFLGIVLGVVVGSIPLKFPGMHTGITIGLAGGPLIVAILLSRLGHFGSIIWYMPPAASNLFRDFGMAVFLACTGLQSGGQLIPFMRSADGLTYLGWGALITMLPVTLVAVFARVVMKMNFVTLVGLVCGSMTSTPTMLFANDFTKSEEPALVFAAVYPLGMIIPIFAAQTLATALG